MDGTKGFGRRLMAIGLCTGLLGLAACSAAPARENEGSGQLSITSWGGTIQEAYEARAVPAFEESSGSRVLFTATDDITSMAKVRAEKDGTSTYDVVTTLGIPMTQMGADGLLAPVSPDEIPNLANVDEKFRTEFGVPNFYSTRAIVYNADAVGDNPPESWADLWDPRFKGKIGVETSHDMDWLFAAAAAVKGSPPVTDEDWDAGWELVSELPEQARIYGESTAQAMNSGEISIFMGSLSSARDLNEDTSMNIVGVVPTEGTWAKVDLSVIPKNAPDLTGAYEFLNAVLDPESQRAIYESSGYIPSVTNVDIPPNEFEEVAGDAAAQERTIMLDYAYIAANADEWHERWQKEVLEK